MIDKLLRQQAAIAAFGTFALRETDLPTVLNEAARVCAQGIGVRFAKVCRYREEEHDLIIEAGHGWSAGIVGYVIMREDARTPQAQAFRTGKPVICNLLHAEGKYTVPAFYAEHGIVSTIDVVIRGDGQPYGILEIDSSEQRDYDQHDVDFLTSFANVLGEAVATTKRIEVLAGMVREKTRLLDQKNILAQELQHRVRNNLQLVHGMLNRQIKYTNDELSQRGLKAISRRVMTLSHVYDQLLGAEMARTMDFSHYVQSLCVNLLEVQGSTGGLIRLECSCDPVILELDAVTSLGIMVTELVTNSFEHAFPAGEGVISVSVHYDDAAKDAVMTISDDGYGFTPKVDSKRHGLGLVHRLSEQIGGTAIFRIDNGAKWTITFPVISF